MAADRLELMMWLQSDSTGCRYCCQDKEGQSSGRTVSWMTLSMSALDLWILGRCTDFLDTVPGKLQGHLLGRHTNCSVCKVDILNEVHMRGIVRCARYTVAVRNSSGTSVLHSWK